MKHSKYIIAGFFIPGLCSVALLQAEPGTKSVAASAEMNSAPDANSTLGANSAVSPRFVVTFDSSVQTTPYTGRLYVVVTDKLGSDSQRDHEPRSLITNWFDPPDLYAQDVKDLPPSSGLIIEGGCLSYPVPLSQLPAGKYLVQAIARRNLDVPTPGEGAGDLYSDVQTIELPLKNDKPITLQLKHVVQEQPFEETDRVKLVEMKSPSLSSFHNRDIVMRAAVILPADWNEHPDRRYPVLYWIPGFGDSHRMARWIAQSRPDNHLGNQMLMVIPDTRCYRGHHVFADSANNGPWGRAFVEELIPHIESKFRGATLDKHQPGKHRYVMGISSGGWSALWLQVTYPDQFNGCWAHCPDPVDFRDFQRINLYQPGANMFVDEKGNPRPLARDDNKILIYYEDFIKREEVLGPGGQIRSFEAVFSPRGKDGNPLSLFDASTGKVNTKVAKTWKPFDIRLILKHHWKPLGPKLTGKLHVYAGEQDTFYLEGSVRLLQKTLENLGSDAEVLIVPGMGHAIYGDAVNPMYETILSNFATNPSMSTPESSTAP